MFDIQKAEKYLTNLGGTHLLNHAKRTLHISKLLAKAENMDYDEEALTFACYFHDIGMLKPYRPEGVYDHAMESRKAIPQLTHDYGISEKKLNKILEAIQYHHKKGLGEFNETMLLRNANAVDFLGFIAAARVFSRHHMDMSAALTELKKHREEVASLPELKSALFMAGPRIKKLDYFIAAFEAETFGIY
ncbi:MAG: HD domain-containing protein [Clostridiales bacterium]|jgi:HD superfamily phosphodiesterase|nr:HD domain-containing protein [Clostridiales bacterium]